MTTGRYARLAARVLAHGLAEDVRPPASRVRAEAIEAIERALRARAERRRRVRWLAIGSIAAATLLALGGGLAHVFGREPVTTGAIANDAPIRVIAHPSGRGAVVMDRGESAALGDGSRLRAGSRVIARTDGQALLSLSTGTRLVVEEGGDLAVVDQGANQRFALHAGGIRADVAKLRRGERFVIRTPDAEVEVHGTSFRVGVVAPDAECGAGTRTRVVVFEGVVSVRHGATTSRVRPGERWPADCPVVATTPAVPAGPTAAATSSAVEATSGSPGANATSVRSRPASSEHGERSALAEENDAFAEAVALRRAGRTGSAIQAFDRFLARYPRGRLSESASASRMRLLRSASSPRSAEVARRYLAAYPNGFASDEARQILSTP